MPLALLKKVFMNNILFSLATVGESIVNGLNGALGTVWYLVLVNFFGVPLRLSAKTFAVHKNGRFYGQSLQNSAAVHEKGCFYG